MARLAHIRRHPIKSHGREALDSVTLQEGQTLPWDRTWAIAHEGSKADGSSWVPCANFSRGAKAPSLMAIGISLDEASEEVTLSHPDLAPITLHPERDADALLTWSKPLLPAERAQSARVIRVPGRGMTDTDFPSISLANLATNAAVGAALGTDLSIDRWRANLWLDGLEPWQEFDWIGKQIAIGEAVLDVQERITRCLATTANPETGARDADTLGALKGWGHQDFGIYVTVAKGGTIRCGDTAHIL